MRTAVACSLSVSSPVPATALLLYTDGLVERRAPDLDEGMDRLRDAFADLPLQELCDRLHRQDRPRPAEAGPRIVPDVVPAERPA